MLLIRPLHLHGARTMGNPYLEVRYLMFKKYILYGDITFDYNYTKTKRETDTSSYTNTYETFGHSYSLNLKSFIYDPRIVIVTAGTTLSFHELDSHSSVKRYYLDLDFFKLLPFNFTVRSSYVDGDNYNTTDIGLTLSFLRKKKKIEFRNMREWSQWLQQQQLNRKNRQQKNYNQNLNQQGLNQSQNLTNQQMENQQMPLTALKPKTTLLDRFAPVLYHFDLDRFETKYENSPDKRLSYNSSFRAAGYDHTKEHSINYWFLYDYRDSQEFIDNTTTDRKYHGLDFNLRANFLKSKSTLDFRTTYDYYDETYKRRELHSDLKLSGPIKDTAWRYHLSESYTRSGDNNQYNTSGGVGTSYGGRGYRINFNASAGYHYYESISRGNYYVASSLGASKRLSSRQDINLSSGLNIGSEAASYNATAGTNYIISRRFRFNGSYSYSATTGQYREYFVGATAKEEQHRITGSLLGRLNWGTLNSSATYTRQIGSKSFNLQSTLATTLRRMRLNLSAGYSYSKADNSPSSQQSVHLGQSLSFSPWYNAFARVSQQFSKSWGSTSESYSYVFNPGLFWRIRMLFFSMNYKFTYTNYQSINSKTAEHRVYMKLTRPFYL